MKREQQIQADATAFAKRWEGRGYEKGDSQTFWIELLHVFGVDKPSEFVRFEQQAALDHTSFIDVMIPSTRVMIEQKSLGKDLRKGILQSDGSWLSPFQQAQRYIGGLPLSQHPRWIVTCNFAEFDVYDMENPKGEPMAWMRAVCGRLEMRYRYSKDIVYNNFPWPSPTPDQQEKIAQTAQAILDARALYPDSSLADLYDELTMPPELRRAHQDNDRAVMAAYGFSTKMTESDCVAALFRLYEEMVKE